MNYNVVEVYIPPNFIYISLVKKFIKRRWVHIAEKSFDDIILNIDIGSKPNVP